MDHAAPAQPIAAPSLHAGIVTSRFVATCEFYYEYFGFTPLEITAEYALLGDAHGARLGILRAAGEGQPAALQLPTRGSGLWLALEADDPDTLHEQLLNRGVEIVADPEFTESGVRRCVVRDPNGVLIYLVGRRAPALDFQAHNVNHHDQDHRSSIHGVSRH